MYSTLVAISILVQINIGEKCLTNFLMNVSTSALHEYLRSANIYKGESTKKKTELIEMIVYGCITNSTNKYETKEISKDQASKILRENKIKLKSLPGYGNSELKKKDKKLVTNERCCIKISD